MLDDKELDLEILCKAFDWMILLLRTIKDILEAIEDNLIALLDLPQLSGFLTLYIQ
jgi:hypothetical protein